MGYGKKNLVKTSHQLRIKNSSTIANTCCEDCQWSQKSNKPGLRPKPRWPSNKHPPRYFVMGTITTALISQVQPWANNSEEKKKEIHSMLQTGINKPSDQQTPSSPWHAWPSSPGQGAALSWPLFPVTLERCPDQMLALCDVSSPEAAPG